MGNMVTIMVAMVMDLTLTVTPLPNLPASAVAAPAAAAWAKRSAYRASDMIDSNTVCMGFNS